MMLRSQITLDPELQKSARRRAAHLGVSLAEYIRRLIARDLNAAVPVADLSAVFDLGSSSGSNVAKDKDAMIGEAAAAGRRRERSR